MKFEVGKKYRIEGSDKPWEVVAVDKRGTAWGLLNGVMAYQNFIEIIGEWHDKPDPGEGWRLLEKFPPEIRQENDEYWVAESNKWCRFQNKGEQAETLWYRRRIDPQYVPYTWDDREELRGRWYRLKNEKNSERQITLFDGDINNMFINGWIPKEFLGLCEWLDGSPCGKRVM